MLPKTDPLIGVCKHCPDIYSEIQSNIIIILHPLCFIYLQLKGVSFGLRLAVVCGSGIHTKLHTFPTCTETRCPLEDTKHKAVASWPYSPKCNTLWGWCRGYHFCHGHDVHVYNPVCCFWSAYWWAIEGWLKTRFYLPNHKCELAPK